MLAHSPSTIRRWLCIKGPLEMPFVSDMAGLHHFYHLTVFVDTISHAMSCTNGGFPSIRHNEIRDLTAKVLTETCHNVGIEPPLQPISDEHFRHKTANSENGAWLDIAADNFWGNDRQRAFFDIRVFNPHAPSYRNKSPMQRYKLNEQEKNRAYKERVREIEHGSFAPLVFSGYLRRYWSDSDNCIQKNGLAHS